jgi:hypothetical protein
MGPCASEGVKNRGFAGPLFGGSGETRGRDAYKRYESVHSGNLPLSDRSIPTEVDPHFACPPLTRLLGMRGACRAF